VHCESHGSIQFFRCRSTHFDASHTDVIRSFFMLEKGVLPDAGGWADQASQWVEAVQVVEREVEGYRAKAMKEARSGN